MKNTKSRKIAKPATLTSKFITEPSTIISVFVTNRKSGVKEEGFQTVNLPKLRMNASMGKNGRPVYFAQSSTWKKAKEIPEKEFGRLAKLFIRWGKACRLATETGKPAYVSFE